ncbi:MAG: hypothetical protein M3N41_13705, partial [Acidobacteriota bacterium]|nr:hypothetical protein [Acidobacteriota bacterium]
MRCLQCGKDLPLLKRMSGSEFCSDAHRREYQKEYSDLALGRLLQSKPPGLQNIAGLNGPPSVLTPMPPGNGHSAAPSSVTLPAMPKLEAVVAPTKTVPAAPPSAAKKTEARAAIPPSSAAAPANKVEPDPAIAKAARVDKPVPADVPLLLPRKLAFEEARSPRPGAPFHDASVTTAALREAHRLPLGRAVVVADVAIHAIERELELRELARSAPRMELDLRIAGPETLEWQREFLAIPVMASLAPEGAAPWTAGQREFPAALISLGSLAGFGLSTTGFEEPSADVGAAAATAAAPARIPTEAPTVASVPMVEEPGVSAPTAPEPVLERLPFTVQGIAAGRAKPGQVFGAALFGEKTIQVPPPSGLPLRPLMVLGPAASAAAPAAGKKSKSDVRILPRAAVEPSLPVVTAEPPVSGEADRGLPELRFESGGGAGASRMPKIMAAVAGAAALGLGIFFFLGRGETRPEPAVETTTSSANWISYSASDAKSQRRVSVLRTSMGLAAYRLDFESSIQIKGLGWVYRAQDAKNYYVSKIELERPGLNAEFAIVHYTVIDGVEQAHAQTPLQVGVPLGGHYKIGFEAVDGRFTTWVQGKQVDQWM